jgi:hypothetical protein
VLVVELYCERAVVLPLTGKVAAEEIVRGGGENTGREESLVFAKVLGLQ